MSSAARKSFLASLESLRQSLDSPLVSGSDAVGSFLRRGLTIVSYNLLEAFVAARLSEIAAHVNGGVAHFGDLPDKLQRAATSDVLRIANSRVQRAGWDLTSAVAFTTQVGNSLAASSGPLQLSPLTWQWPGSNMGAEDARRAMRLFHVQSPWSTIATISNRTGIGIPDPSATMAGLLRERNYCAHESAYQVSNLWIRAVPHQIQTIAMGFDIAISVSAHELHVGQRDFLNDEDWMCPSRITFRFIEQRKSKWVEILEGATRAAHINADMDLLLRNAINSSRGKHQLVIVRDQALQVLDWVYPELP